MAVPVHSKNAHIMANGYDVSGFFKSAASKVTVETAETSTFGSSAKSYLPGLSDGTFALDGYFDGTALVGSDAILAAIVGSAAVFTMLPAGDAVGARGRAASVIETTVETTADVGSAIQVKVDGQASGGMDPIVCMHPLQAETITGNGTDVDNLVVSANGAVCYLQVTAMSGTGGPTLTVKLQHSPDGTVWTDLITHTAVTAANKAERVAVVGGNVNRHLRAIWTIAGTGPSFTFNVAAARL